MLAAARTRIKICGLTRPDDILSAVQAGADAIGLVMYSKSSRALTVDQARALRSGVPAFISVVCLVVNASESEVMEVIEKVQPDLLQFHGDESPEYCQRFGRRYVRAFRIGAPGLDSADAVLQQCRLYQSASAWLFDSYSEGYGGSGRTLDTSLLQAVQSAEDSRPMILAGGLTPDSVCASVQKVRPYAVDVSSGVETAPGIKSPDKIRRFVAAAQAFNLSGVPDC